MAVQPQADLDLKPLGGDAKTLEEWLTIFHLVGVVIDPYTYESAWLLETAGRVLEGFRPADCRVAFIVTANEDDAREFLGPWTDRMLTFVDPDRALTRQLELETLPAFVHIGQNGTLEGAAAGWNPAQWHELAGGLAKVLSWTAPAIPAPGDPAPFAGSPAAG
ncbi:MAG: hypothetical protein GY745_11125 [Actinomycetia bacterium]|nr:hypothetical protein [Actinomycetes bacterium]MCP4085590.1 hypothetical protein [Actinomycetes bacterium]